VKVWLQALRVPSSGGPLAKSYRTASTLASFPILCLLPANNSPLTKRQPVPVALPGRWPRGILVLYTVPPPAAAMTGPQQPSCTLSTARDSCCCNLHTAVNNACMAGSTKRSAAASSMLSLTAVECNGCLAIMHSVSQYANPQTLNPKTQGHVALKLMQHKGIDASLLHLLVSICVNLPSYTRGIAASRVAASCTAVRTHLGSPTHWFGPMLYLALTSTAATAAAAVNGQAW